MRIHILALVPLLASCGKGGILDRLPGADTYLPKVSFDTLEVTDIDFERVRTVFVIKIRNPNPIGVSLASYGWDLDLDGRDFVSGDSAEGLRIEPRSTTRVRIPVVAAFTDVLQTVGGVSGKDEVPFTISGKLGFDTPVGEVAVPYRASGGFPVLQVPQIGFEGVRFEGIDVLRQTATVAVDVGLRHEQAARMTFDAFDYGLSLGGRRLVGGVIGRLAAVPPGTTKTVSLPITVNLLSAGQTVVDAIQGGGQVQVGLDATLTVKTPFGPVPLSVDETGRFRVER